MCNNLKKLLQIKKRNVLIFRKELQSSKNLSGFK